MLPDLKLDDIVRMRKPHPCGGDEWKIVRLGADIGLECCRCQRRVLLPRRELARRIKKLSEEERMNPHHSERPKVLFLFSDTGGGHRSAAEAIIEALDIELSGPDSN